MRSDEKKRDPETTKERYASLLGKGSVEALIEMVKEAEQEIAAGRTYSAEEVKEHFKNKRR